MMSLTFSSASVALMLALTLGVSQHSEAQHVRLVNVIPRRYSGESRNNPEASLAIHPKGPDTVVFTAHLTGDDMCTSPQQSGFFVSRSHGNNWTLWCRLSQDSGAHALDLTTSFSGDGAWMHVAHIVPGQRLKLVGAADLSSPNNVSDLLSERLATIEGQDQPQLRTRPGLNEQEVALALVNLGYRVPGPPTCRFARLLWARETRAPVSFLSSCLDYRSVMRPWAIRLAMHSSGVTYVVFSPVYTSENASGASVVIVRGIPSSSMRMDDLIDLDSGNGCGGDSLPGKRIVCERHFVFESAMQQAFGWENIQGSLAIAVDPSNWRNVYVAWGDSIGNGARQTLHVRRSSTGGETWGDDIFEFRNATNPALAVDEQGRLGFLFQQYDDSLPAPHWHTRFAWTDSAGTPLDTIDLAVTPAGPDEQPDENSKPFQGDWATLIAVGSEFYGAFAARNDPDEVRFPFGALYNRRCSGGALRSRTNTIVDPSVDPFFFHVRLDRPSNELPSGSGLTC